MVNNRAAKSWARTTRRSQPGGKLEGLIENSPRYINESCHAACKMGGAVTRVPLASRYPSGAHSRYHRYNRRITSQDWETNFFRSRVLDGWRSWTIKARGGWRENLDSCEEHGSCVSRELPKRHDNSNEGLISRAAVEARRNRRIRETERGFLPVARCSLGPRSVQASLIAQEARASRTGLRASRK